MAGNKLWRHTWIKDINLQVEQGKEAYWEEKKNPEVDFYKKEIKKYFLKLEKDFPIIIPSTHFSIPLDNSFKKADEEYTVYSKNYKNLGAQPPLETILDK